MQLSDPASFPDAFSFFPPMHCLPPPPPPPMHSIFFVLMHCPPPPHNKVLPVRRKHVCKCSSSGQDFNGLRVKSPRSRILFVCFLSAGSGGDLKDASSCQKSSRAGESDLLLTNSQTRWLRSRTHHQVC